MSGRMEREALDRMTLLRIQQAKTPADEADTERLAEEATRTTMTLEAMGEFRASACEACDVPRRPRVFISFHARDGTEGGGSDMFKVIFAALQHDYDVFDPYMDFITPTKEEMAREVKKSDFFIAVVTREYFDSEFCMVEVNAAREAKIPHVPVYDADRYTLKAKSDLMKLSEGDTYADLRKFVFQENLVPVVWSAGTKLVTGNFVRKATAILSRWLEEHPEKQHALIVPPSPGRSGSGASRSASGNLSINEAPSSPGRSVSGTHHADGGDAAEDQARNRDSLSLTQPADFTACESAERWSAEDDAGLSGDCFRFSDAVLALDSDQRQDDRKDYKVATGDFSREGRLFVQAPSGYGKTVLASSLVEREQETPGQELRVAHVEFAMPPTSQTATVTDVWPRFLVALQTHFKALNKSVRISSRRDVPGLIEEHFDFFIFDDLQYVMHDHVFLREVRTLWEYFHQKKTKLLLLSQKPFPLTAKPYEFTPTCLLRGLEVDEAVNLFNKLHPRDKRGRPSSRRDEQDFEKKVAVITEHAHGHPSVLRHIFDKIDLLNICFHDLGSTSHAAEDFLQRAFEHLPLAARKLLKHVAVLEIPACMELLNHLAGQNELETENGESLSPRDIRKLRDSHWLHQIANPPAFVMKDFERSYLLDTLALKEKRKHASLLAKVLYEGLQPERICPNVFASRGHFNAQENPFFPDAEQTGAEMRLAEECDDFPGQSRLSVLAELVRTMLEAGDAGLARDAVPYLLLSDRVQFNNGKRAEVIQRINSMCKQLHYRTIPAQLRIRRIRVEIEKCQSGGDQAFRSSKSMIENFVHEEELQNQSEDQTLRSDSREQAVKLLKAISFELRGSLEQKRPNPAQALIYYQQALELMVQCQNHKGQASTHRFIAECLVSLTRYEQAGEHSLKAADTWPGNPFYDWYHTRQAASSLSRANSLNHARHAALRATENLLKYLPQSTVAEEQSFKKGLAEHQGIVQELFSGTATIAVIFDVDGVLVDTEVLKLRAWQQVIRRRYRDEHAEHFTPNFYWRCCGHDFHWILNKFTTNCGLAIDDKDAAELKIQWDGAYNALRKEKVSELPCAQLLRKFVQIRMNSGTEYALPGLVVGIATSDDRDNMIDNLKQIGVDVSQLDAAVCGEDVENRKPAPDIYKLAVERLEERAGYGTKDPKGNTETRSAVVIEDSSAGVQSALDAGVPSVLVVPRADGTAAFEGFDKGRVSMEKPEALTTLEVLTRAFTTVKEGIPLLRPLPARMTAQTAVAADSAASEPEKPAQTAADSNRPVNAVAMGTTNTPPTTPDTPTAGSVLFSQSRLRNQQT